MCIQSHVSSTKDQLLTLESYNVRAKIKYEFKEKCGLYISKGSDYIQNDVATFFFNI